MRNFRDARRGSGVKKSPVVGNLIRVQRRRWRQNPVKEWCEMPMRRLTCWGPQIDNRSTGGWD
jgi:hypothetical protein